MAQNYFSSESGSKYTLSDVFSSTSVFTPSPEPGEPQKPVKTELMSPNVLPRTPNKDSLFSCARNLSCWTSSGFSKAYMSFWKSLNQTAPTRDTVVTTQSPNIISRTCWGCSCIFSRIDILYVEHYQFNLFGGQCLFGDLELIHFLGRKAKLFHEFIGAFDIDIEVFDLIVHRNNYLGLDLAYDLQGLLIVNCITSTDRNHQNIHIAYFFNLFLVQFFLAQIAQMAHRHVLCLDYIYCIGATFFSFGFIVI